MGGILTEALERQEALGERLLSSSSKALAAERPAVIRPELGVAAEREHYVILQTTTHEPGTTGDHATVERPVKPSPVRQAVELQAADAHEQADAPDALVITTVVVACNEKGIVARPRRVLWVQTRAVGGEG